MRRFLHRAAIGLTAGTLLVSGAYITSTLITATPLAERCTVRVDGRETTLDVAQAESAALIVALSVRRDYPSEAATVALAAAYQESELRNLDHGDRDSLGLFQQRPSQGWGTPEQVTDPYYATQSFYDHLLEVDGFEQMPVAEAAQRVQRSAHGEAYAQHEQKAKALTAAFTGRSQAAFSCRLVDQPARAVASAQNDDSGPAGDAVASGSSAGARASTEASTEASTGANTGGAGGSTRDSSGGGARNRAGAEEDGRTGEPHAGEHSAGKSSGASASDSGPGDTTESVAERGPAAQGAGDRQSEGASTDAGVPDTGTKPTDGKGTDTKGTNDGNPPADRDTGDADSPGSVGGNRPDAPTRAVQQELELAFGPYAGRPPANAGANPANPDATADRDGRRDDSDDSDDAQPDRAQPGGTAKEQKSRQPAAKHPEADGSGERTAEEEGGPTPADPTGSPAAIHNGTAEPGRTTANSERAADRVEQTSEHELRVRVDDEQVGWAIAHWSVANTKRLGIVEVSYDGRSWSAPESADGWVRGDSATDDKVRIRVDD